MTFLPIIWRELNVASRKPAAFRTRMFIVLSCLLLWITMTVAGSRASSRELGRMLFLAFGVLAFAFALLAGCLLTADCLSEEKREGTLGLLFLTPLRGYDIVLGKLIANSIHSVYGLLAIFPILSLPLLMGGVSFASFLRVILVLILTLFFSLGTGICVSVFSRETRDAIARALSILILFSGVLPALWWLLANLHNRFRAFDFLLYASPVFTFRSAFDEAYFGSAKKAFWLSGGFLGLFFFISLLVACFFLPTSWQEKSSVVRKKSSRKPGASQPPLARFANPVIWLGRRPGKSSSAPRILFSLVGLVWLVSFLSSLASRRAHAPFIVCLFSAFAFHLVAKSFNILEATRQMSAARASGALELLLVTPLRDDDIHHGLFAAIRSRCLVRNLAMVCINLVILGAVWSFSAPFMSRLDKKIFSEIILGGTLLVPFDFLATRSVGLWSAYATRSQNRALFPTIARVFLPSWGALFLMVFSMSIMTRGSATTAAVFIGLWVAFSIFWDLFIFVRANARLRRGFRFEEKQPVIREHYPPVSCGTLDAARI
jgi:ABC-type transport system involved in multi-copper enzyme maturation permease subunit